MSLAESLAAAQEQIKVIIPEQTKLFGINAEKKEDIKDIYEFIGIN